MQPAVDNLDTFGVHLFFNGRASLDVMHGHAAEGTAEGSRAVLVEG